MVDLQPVTFLHVIFSQSEFESLCTTSSTSHGTMNRFRDTTLALAVKPRFSTLIIAQCYKKGTPIEYRDINREKTLSWWYLVGPLRRHFHCRNNCDFTFLLMLLRRSL